MYGRRSQVHGKDGWRERAGRGADWEEGCLTYLVGAMLELGPHLFRCVLFFYINGEKERELFTLSRLGRANIEQEEIRPETKESVSYL